jgi:hypothetical protein
MKTRIVFFSVFLFYVSSVSFSQSPAENKDSLVKAFSNPNVAMISYPVTTGTETSGFFYYREYPWIETYGVSIALYRGEPCSFYKINRSITQNSPLYHTYNLKTTDYRYSDTFMFFDPGISIYSLNRKYSLGLYKRIETPVYNNGDQFIAPLKVNIHF